MFSRTMKRSVRKTHKSSALNRYLKFYQQPISKSDQSPVISNSGPQLPSDTLSGLLLEDAILFNAAKKILNPPDKLLFLSVLAGIWVGIGGLAAVSAAGGIPEDVRNRWLFLPKFVMGAFFAFGEIRR
jgi:hypothetical protein